MGNQFDSFVLYEDSISVKALSHAKINLFLRVIGKRTDGYHELVTLLCLISLCDTISLKFGIDNISISCDDPNVPDDYTNLAYKAAAVFFKAFSYEKGVDIFIEKKIPVGAGLGGGSSNAATVLCALNRFFSYPFSRDYLMSLGLSIGADVPFFIFGQPALATGIGEKLQFFKGLDKFYVLIIFPGFSISTSMVYKNFNLGLTKSKKKNINNFVNIKKFDGKSHVVNDLETVTLSNFPEVLRAKRVLVDNGAIGVLMSGSGSSVFGLYSDLKNAMRAKKTIPKTKNWRIFIAEMLV